LPSVKRNEFDDQAKEGNKEAVKELEQFLGDKASLFWHELRYVLPSILLVPCLHVWNRW
jgi:hypothetical protein